LFVAFFRIAAKTQPDGTIFGPDSTRFATQKSAGRDCPIRTGSVLCTHQTHPIPPKTARYPISDPGGIKGRSTSTERWIDRIS